MVVLNHFKPKDQHYLQGNQHLEAYLVVYISKRQRPRALCDNTCTKIFIKLIKKINLLP